MKERVKKLKSDVAFWMLKFVAKNAPETLVSFVAEKANEIAVTLVMQILDNERLAHCKVCPRRAPLRKAADGYRCNLHYQEG